MTGTKDLAPIGNADMKSRLAVYPALHSAPKYELVLHNAEHSVFTERGLPGDREPRNPNHPSWKPKITGSLRHGDAFKVRHSRAVKTMLTPTELLII